MKSNIFLSIIILIALSFTGCKKDNSASNQASTSSTPGSNKNYKNLQTLSQLISSLEATNNGTITIQSQNSAYDAAKGKIASSMISGVIYNSSSGSNYSFQVGESNKYSATYTNGTTSKLYQFAAPPSSTLNSIYGTTQAYTLTQGSTQLFTTQLYTPTLINMATADMTQNRSNFNITWNSDPNNSLGVIIKIDMYTTNGAGVGTEAALVPDNGTANISSLLANYPKQNNFDVQIYRGNYAQITLANGQIYNVVNYTLSLQGLNFQ